MLRMCTDVIRSTAPAAFQAASLFVLLSYSFPLKKPDILCKVKSANKIKIWLRVKGLIVCVNNTLAKSVGRSADQFVGLPYEQSDLDQQQIQKRIELDEQLNFKKQPVVVCENTESGLVDTFNAPLLSSDGSVLATVHISTLLDFSQCLQPHAYCQDRFYAALQGTVRKAA